MRQALAIIILIAFIFGVIYVLDNLSSEIGKLNWIAKLTLWVIIVFLGYNFLKNLSNK
jgi:hypothetical protein